MNRLIFVLGGARSGKSRFAVEYGSTLGRTKVYIATAQPLDPEMTRRIEIHRQERPSDWKTVEAPLDLAGALRSLEGAADVAVIDCLTLWLSNLLIQMEADEKRIRDEIDQFVAGAGGVDLPVVVVSNEVGLGIVPADPSSRLFRDLAGVLHQQLARVSHEVYWVTAGIAVPIKGDRHAKTSTHP